MIFFVQQTKNMRMIVAMDAQGGIGLRGALPWPRCKEDMAHFAACTRGCACIMGARTWESLGARPLRARRNIVLSRSMGHAAGAEIWRTLQGAHEDMWCIGGAQIYALCAPHTTEIHISRFPGVYACDTFFPVHILRDFECVHTRACGPYTYERWERVPKHGYHSGERTLPGGEDV